MAILNSITPTIWSVVSFIVGFLAFYLLTSEKTSTQKKQHMEEMTSLLLNFVIFIWVSKIILKSPVFIQDPMAILAYPSHSTAFYLAILFSALNLAYKAKLRKLDVVSLLNSFIFVFLVASLVYEFIQLVWYDNMYSIGYMTVLAVLLICYLFIQERITTKKSIIFIGIGWTIGNLLLTWIMPITMVFGYTMTRWFLIVFLMTCLIFIRIDQRKMVA